MRPPIRPALLGIACLGLAACTSTLAAPAPPPSRVAVASPTPTTTPTPSPSPTPSQRTSPLTGLPEDASKPVLVVKLDNTHRAQPHAGLVDADVVYLEEVEYGITRIAAVFSSTIPDRIGPVRSARITDIDLLAQYGEPAFGYSGAQRKMLPVIADSPLIDVSPVTNARGYERDPARYAPYNLFTDGTALVEQAPQATTDHDMGWVFSTEVPAGGRPVHKAAMEWEWASASFTYDEANGDYRIRLNDRAAEAEERDTGQRASTVVIQLVHQQPSAYFDKGGGNTPHADTIGHGTAIVLRDGQAWNVRWDRPDAQSGTTFTLADGTPLAFKPGQTWFVLLDEQRPPTIKAPKATPSASASIG